MTNSVLNSFFLPNSQTYIVFKYFKINVNKFQKNSRNSLLHKFCRKIATINTSMYIKYSVKKLLSIISAWKILVEKNIMLREKKSILWNKLLRIRNNVYCLILIRWNFYSLRDAGYKIIEPLVFWIPWLLTKKIKIINIYQCNTNIENRK